MRIANLRAFPPIVLFLFAGVVMHAQVTTVSGKIVSQGSQKAADVGNVVAWLVPTSGPAINATPDPKPITAKLVQKDKMFHPRLLVLPAGSSVRFPNRDPFFHNVFSLFNGERFDLGLYEAGDSRTVNFDRVGVSYIFCNIHPEMSAVIIVLKTPYYAVSGADGSISIRDVPAGQYDLHVFADGLSTDAQRALTKKVTIGPDTSSLGSIELPERRLSAHKNKYGRDYEHASSAPYEH